LEGRCGLYGVSRAVRRAGRGRASCAARPLRQWGWAASRARRAPREFWRLFWREGADVMCFMAWPLLARRQACCAAPSSVLRVPRPTAPAAPRPVCCLALLWAMVWRGFTLRASRGGTSCLCSCLRARRCAGWDSRRDAGRVVCIGRGASCARGTDRARVLATRWACRGRLVAVPVLVSVNGWLHSLPGRDGGHRRRRGCLRAGAPVASCGHELNGNRSVILFSVVWGSKLGEMCACGRGRGVRETGRLGRVRRRAVRHLVGHGHVGGPAEAHA